MNREFEAAGQEPVAVFAPLYPPAFKGGGPIRSISALVASAPVDKVALVFAGNRDLGDSDPLPVAANQWQEQGRALVYYVSVPRNLLRGLMRVRECRPTLLHFNSFFNPFLTIIPLVLWRFGFWGRARILLAPRGEFGDAALARRSLKKRLYIFLFRLLRLDRIVVWHSTAPHETADLRRMWGVRALIVERENDTALPLHARTPEVAEGPIRAVFLGRIVEHKGLAVALEALKAIISPIDVDVYGSPEDAAYVARCRSLAEGLPSTVRVSFHGPIEPEQVASVLSDHDVLLMPTAGENFGHAIAEALSVSCAVVTTPSTPWTEVLQGGGGVVVERTPTAWTTEIERMARETPQQRLARRRSAGDAYERWASAPRKPHVWTLANDVLSESR